MDWNTRRKVTRTITWVKGLKKVSFLFSEFLRFSSDQDCGFETLIIALLITIVILAVIIINVLIIGIVALYRRSVFIFCQTFNLI